MKISISSVYRFSSWFLAAVMAVGPVPVQVLAQGPITADGRTATNISVSGNTTDITTQTISGVNAFNSFEQFSVLEGQTVNLHLPQGTANLVNTVTGETRTEIQGTLNALLANGEIGGNVFLLNPNGILVGETGTINVGALGLSTPAVSFIDSLFEAVDDPQTSEVRLVPDMNAVSQVLEGNVPLSANGSIVVKGKIHAGWKAELLSNRVEVGPNALIRLTPEYRVPLEEVVNIQGLESAADVQVVDEDTIRIVGKDGVSIEGELAADGNSEKTDGGRISISTAGGEYSTSETHYEKRPIYLDENGNETWEVTDTPKMESVTNAVRPTDEEGNITGPAYIFGTEEDANAENWLELTLEQEENGLPKVWEDAETGEKYCLKANGERVPYSDGMTGVYRMETTEVQAYDVEETEIAAADGTVNVQIAPEARIHANAAADADGTFLGDGGTIEISADHRITVSGTTAEGIFEAHGIRNGTVTLSGEIADLNGRIVTDSQFRVLADSISWDGGADGLFYFTQGGTAGNSQLEDLTVSGADISLDSKGTITLKNVHISTRAVQENASYASAQERWTLHQTANSTGNSGSVNIKAGALVLENSEILTSARNTEGTAFSAGDVAVTLRDKEGSLTIGGKSYKTGMRLTNSAIDAGNWTVDASGKASLSSGGGKVRVSISDNSFTNLFDFGGRASAGFLLDENSAIFAGEMDLNVSAASGAYLDVSGESAETVENYGLTLFRHLTNFLSFADSGRVNEADALILLDGRIQLSGDLDAESYAAANASFTTRGVNLGFAFVKNRASSDFTIGSSAEILAQNIDLESRMNTSVYAGWSADFLGFSTTVRAIPLDVGVAVTVVETENTLTVENGAVLEAAERLALTASTENDVTGDVSVRAFEDFLGVGFVFSDVRTRNELRIGDSTETGSGTELAILSGKDVELTAFTDLSTNVGSYAQVGGTTNIDVMKLANRLSKNRLDQLTGKIDAFIKRNLSFLNSLDTTKFGLTMGAAIQNTSLENQLTVGSAARISARDSLGLNSESHYLYHTNAYTLMGEAYNAENIPVPVTAAAAIGLPVLVSDTSTKLTVRADAILAADSITLTARTVYPYEYSHLLKDIFFDGDLSGLSAEAIYGILMDDSFGILEGATNSMVQAMASGDKAAVSGSVNALDISTETVAKVEDGVKIWGAGSSMDGKTVTQASSLNAEASTDISVVNLAGALASGWRAKFKPTWGTDAKVGVGASVLFVGLSSITIADISPAQILAKNTAVHSDSSIIDAALTLGAGKGKSFGFSGMIASSVLDTYTLAKIDDSTQIGTESLLADSVSVTSEDAVLSISAGGSVQRGADGSGLTVSIGLGGAVMEFTRENYAVWGNLLDEDGKLATIRGYETAESLASDSAGSWVRDAVTLNALTSGVNVIYALAGTFDNTTAHLPVEEVNEDGIEMVDLTQEAENGPTDGGETVTANLHSAWGIAGDASVSLIDETTYAILNGGTVLHFNPDGTGSVLNADGTPLGEAQMKIHAENATFHHALAGSASFQWGTGTGAASGGIAGSFAFLTDSADTLALAGLEKLDFYSGLKSGFTVSPTKNTLDVSAEKTGESVLLSIGAAGAFTNSRAEIPIAGSAGYAMIGDSTRAEIAGTEILTGNADVSLTEEEQTELQKLTAVLVSAKNRADIINLAGGVSISGTVGFGGAAAVSVIEQDTSALLKNVSLSADSLTLRTEDSGLIVHSALGTAIASPSSGIVLFSGAAAIGVLSGTSQAGMTADAADPLSSVVDLTGDLSIQTANTIRTSEEKNATAQSLALEDFMPDEVNEELEEWEEKEIYVGDDLSTVPVTEGSTTGENGESGDPMYRTVRVDVDSNPAKIVSFAVDASVGKIALGSAMSVNFISTTHESILKNVQVRLGGGANVTAGTDGGIYAFNVGGSVGTAGAGGLSAGVNLVSQNTFVSLENMTLQNVRPAGHAFETVQDSFLAENRAQIVSGTLDVRVSTECAAANFLAAYNQTGNRTLVQMKNANILNEFGGIQVSGVADSDIIALMVQAGIAATAGVSANVSINSIGSVKLKDSEELEAQIRTLLDGTFGIASDRAWNHEAGIRILDGSLLSAAFGNLDLNAKTDGQLVSVAVTAAGGGTAAVGVSGSYANIGSATVVDVSDSRLETNDYVFLTVEEACALAEARSAQNGVTLTEAQKTALKNYFTQYFAGLSMHSEKYLVPTASVNGGNLSIRNEDRSLLVNVLLGGSGAGAAGVLVNCGVSDIQQAIQTRFLNSSLIAGNQIASLIAGNGDFVTVGGNAAIGLEGAGVGVNFNYSEYASVLKQLVENSRILSGFGSIDLQTESDRYLFVLSASGAGSGMVGVDANVGLNFLSNEVSVTVSEGAAIHAGGDVLLEARSKDSIFNLTPTIALGIMGGGVGANTTVTDISTQTFVDVLGSKDGISTSLSGLDLYRQADPLTLSVWDSEGNSQDVTVNGVGIYALSDQKVQSLGIAAAGGLYFGAAGSASVILNEAQTRARMFGASVGLSDFSEYFDTPIYLPVEIGLDADGKYSFGEVNPSPKPNLTQKALFRTDGFNFAGGIAGGAGALGVGISLTYLDQTTESTVEDLQTKRELGDESVSENETELTKLWKQKSETANLSSVGIEAFSTVSFVPVMGNGSGGIVGVSGSYSLFNLSGSTTAQLLSTDLNAESLSVRSGIWSDVEMYTVNIAGGAGAAIGSGAETVFDHETSALIGRSAGDAELHRVELGETLTVDAVSENHVRNYAFSVSGGLAAVPVNVQLFDISDRTTAGIAENFAVSTGGDASVNAQNRIFIEEILGSGSAAGVSVGAGVDVLTLRNGAFTQIGDGTQILSKEDVLLNADVLRNVRADDVGAGLNVGAVNSAVTVLNSSEMDVPDTIVISNTEYAVDYSEVLEDARYDFSLLLNGTDAAGNAVDLAQGKIDLDVRLADFYETEPQDSATKLGILTQSNAQTSDVQTAEVTDILAGVLLGKGSVIQADGKLALSARQVHELDLTTVIVQAGGVEVGGSVNVVSLGGNALVRVNGDLGAGTEISIEAFDILKGRGGETDPASVSIGIGQAGLIDAAAGVGVMDSSSGAWIVFSGESAGSSDSADSSETESIVQKISTWNSASAADISVHANAVHRCAIMNGDVQASGITASGIVSFIDDSLTAVIQGNRPVRFQTDRGSILLDASTYSSHDLSTWGVAVNAIAGVGDESNLKNRSTAKVALADDTQIETGFLEIPTLFDGPELEEGEAVPETENRVSIRTETKTDAEVDALGVNAGTGIGVGVSRTIVQNDMTSEILLGNSVKIRGNSVVLDAQTLQNSLTGSAVAGGGELVGSADSAEVYLSGTHDARILAQDDLEILTHATGAAADLTDTQRMGEILFSAKTNANSEANATGMGYGVLAVGVIQAKNDFTVNSEIGLGADSRLTADKIRFLAETNGDLLTNLESGAGGGIDSSAGIVKMAWVPTAKISLAKNSAEFLSQAANNLEASRILLETNTKGTLDFMNDSFRGGLVNGGGAGNDVQIRANSIQDLGNVRILAPNIQIQALTDLLKEKNRQNTYLASGGVIDVAAGTGNQFLAEVEALVNVGDFAKISTGNAERDGELSILAQNTLNAFDTYYLNSGGVICLTVGSSDFLVKKLNANVRIGEDADLFSSRDFSISALSGGEMYMELTANSYGVAGIPDGKGKMHVDSQNAVSIGKNAQLLSLGDMFLGAGSSPQGDSRWNIESIVNTFNGTAIPLSSTASNDYRFTLKNDIKIAGNASLRSVSDISLLSMAGLVRSVAHSYAGNTYAGVSSSEISNIFSDGDGQLYRSDTMEGFVFQGGITTAGKIEAGIYADSRLSIDADGNVSGSDWISWEIEKDAALDQSLESEIQALEEEIRHFQSTGETAYLEALEAEKAQLEALQAMYVGKTADILKLDPIAAAGGDIIAHGNYFRTEGDSASLAANGQAKIEVSNDSAMFLQTNSMEIMGSGNGKFRFNSNQILSQDALNKLNPLDCQAHFQQFAVSNQVVSPEIRIMSMDPAAEVWLYGNLLNEWGSVNVDSAGSIRQEGMIAAQSVNISTGGSFIQNYVTGLYSTGGIPEENPYVQSAVEKFIQEMQGTEKSGETWSSEKKMELSLTSESSIIASGAVFISAEKLNINGMILSGFSDYELDLGANGVLDAVEAFRLRHANGTASSSILDLTSYFPMYAAGYSATPVSVQFDAASDSFTIGDIIARGGSVTLYGNLLSTGGGIIYAASGKSDVNITNPSAYTLNLGNIDLSSDSAGIVKFQDTAFRLIDQDGKTTHLETVYRNQDGRIIGHQTLYDPDTMKILYAEDGTPETKILATGTYSPTPNRWYAWATSQDFELMQDEYETRKYSFWIPAGEKVSEGQEAKIVSPLEQIDSDTLVVDPELDANCDLVAKYHWEMTDSEYTNWKYVGDSKRYFIFYWEEDYERTHTWKENEKFYYYLNASQEIRVNIAPGKNGNVSVQSVGTLNTSSILAPHGKIELTSNSSIQTLRTSADIQSGNISLNVLSDPKYPNAGGGIGMASAPISIRQTNDAGDPLAESSILNIRADLGNVWLQNRYSDTVLNDILAADGAFTLKSQGSILQNSGKTLRAQGLTLQSDTGTIGSLSDPLRIETAVTERTRNLEGNVVLKASGDIAVREMGKADGEGFGDNPLYVEQIESTAGDVKVLAVGGDLLDGNETRDPLQTEEKRARNWLEEHGIIQGEAYEELKKDTVEAAELKLKALYHEFWKNGKAQYDPDFRFAYEEAEKEKMRSVGLSDEKIAESEEELTAFYHESCFDFGNAAYDPDFSRTLTEAEQEKLLAGSLREFAKLKNLLPFETYGEKAAAEVPMSAVISGGKIFLETDQAIGRLKDPLVIEAGAKLHSLDESTIDILQKALPQDVSYVYGDDGKAVSMTVQLKNQLVLNASETVEVSAKNGAILGSVTDLTLDALQVENGDLLLDVQGDLNANSALLAESMTMNVWGNIGSKETPLRVTLQGTESTLDAWAKGGMDIASDSDLRVAHLETLSEAGIRLETASGASVLAAETAYAEHIKAEALQILSDGSIGTETDPLTLAAGTEKGTVSVVLSAKKEISAASKDGLTVQKAESESGSVALSANGGMNVNGEVVGHGVALATENGDLVQSADSAIESKGAENTLTVNAGGNAVLEDAASEGELTASANGGMNVNGEVVGHGVALATENGDLVQSADSAIESKGAENSLTVHSGGNVVLEDAASEGELTASANGGMNVNGEIVGHGVALAALTGGFFQKDGSHIASLGEENVLTVKAREDAVLAALRSEGKVVLLESEDGAILRNSAETTIDALAASVMLRAESGIGSGRHEDAAEKDFRDALSLNVEVLTGAVSGTGGFYVEQLTGNALAVRNIQTQNGSVGILAGISEPSESGAGTELLVEDIQAGNGDVFAANLSETGSLTLQGTLSGENIYAYAGGDLLSGTDLAFRTPDGAGTIQLAAENAVGSVEDPDGFRADWDGTLRIYGQEEVALDITGQGAREIETLLTQNSVQIAGNYPDADSLTIGTYTGKVFQAETKVSFENVNAEADFAFEPLPNADIPLHEPLLPTGFRVDFQVDFMEFDGPEFEFGTLVMDELVFRTDALKIRELQQETRSGEVPLHVDIMGWSAEESREVLIDSIDAAGTVDVSRLYAEYAELTVDAGPMIQIRDGLTSDRVRVDFLDMKTQIDSRDKTAFNDRTHLWTQDGRYSHRIEPQRVETDIYVLNYSPEYIVNREFSTENSVERLTNKEIRLALYEHWFRQERSLNVPRLFIPAEETEENAKSSGTSASKSVSEPEKEKGVEKEENALNTELPSPPALRIEWKAETSRPAGKEQARIL